MRKKRRWHERDGNGGGDAIDDCSLADPQVRLRFLEVSGLVAAGAGVSDALRRRLWEEQEVFLIQQIITALSLIVADDDRNATISCLERYYLLDGCPEPIKLRVLSSLVRICQAREEHSRLLTSLGSILREDLRSTNPVLRIWVLKFVSKFFDRQASREWIAALQGKIVDSHACVRGAALDAFVSLCTMGLGFFDGLHAIALGFLQDQAVESIRLSAIEMLRLWVLDVQAGERTPTLQRDINYTFLQICSVLTDPFMQAKKQACRVLGTMTSVSQKVKLHCVNKKSVLVTRGDPLVSSKINGKEPPTAIVAGAFVSAVEDEFPEVRCAAVEALTSLSLGNKEIANAGVLGLFVDMLNDQDASVRMTTVQALHELSGSGVFIVETKTLNVILATLEDQNKDLRYAGLELLSSLTLPSIFLFESAAETLMKCLSRHPQDEKNVYEALQRLGKAHASHVEALKSELLSQIKDSLDSSKIEVLVERIQIFGNGEEGMDDPRLKAIINAYQGVPKLRSANVSIESDPTAVLAMVQRVVNRALHAGNFRKDDQRATIRGCRKSLQALEQTSFVNLGLLYLDCLVSVAHISLTGVTSEDQLGSILKRIRACFSGLSATGTLQLLELDVFHAVTLAELDTNHTLFSQLSSLVAKSKTLVSTAVEPFALLQQAEESLPAWSDPNGIRNLKAAAASFWPKHDILAASIEELRADLTVPFSSFEHRLKVLMPTLPYHFSISGAVHHLTAGSRIWIQMELEGFPRQYRFLILARDKKSIKFTEEVDFYNMPSITKTVLRVCLVVELELTKSEVVTQRGPRGSVAAISPERLLYLDQT